ncbi:MAG: MFS transporter, partial [Candidatus Melainabacteria bacterium]|nr:MFS transporter [Candidatus Melainabacteria bacterium]
SFSLVDLLLTYFFLPEPKTRSQAGHERFALQPKFCLRTVVDKALRIPLAIFFISTFAFANMEATLVLLTEHQFSFTASQNSLMFAYIGVIMVVMQGGLIGRLSKRFGERTLVLVGCALVAIGLLVTPTTKSAVVLYVALALLAIGSGINTPSNQSILSKLAPASDLGGVLGVGQSLSTLGRIVGPVVGGVCFQYLGMSSPYYIGSAAMVAACALAFFLPHSVPATILESRCESCDKIDK